MDRNKMTTCKKTGLPIAKMPTDPFAGEPALPKATQAELDEYARYLAENPPAKPLICTPPAKNE